MNVRVRANLVVGSDGATTLNGRSAGLSSAVYDLPFTLDTGIPTASILSPAAGLLSNRTHGARDASAPAPKGLQRIADVPIHFADPLARRAHALQRGDRRQADVAVGRDRGRERPRRHEGVDHGCTRSA